MSVGAVLGVLLANAVTVVGVVVLGWSVGSAMILLAVEFTVGSLLLWARVAWHQRYSGDPVYQGEARLEHDVPGGRPTRQAAVWFMPSFGLLVITAAAAIAFGRKWPEHQALWFPRPEELGWGALALVASAGVAFLLELPTLAQRPFADLQRATGQRRLQLVGLAITILVAPHVVAKLQTPLAWLLVQVLFKLTVDLYVATQDAGPARRRSARLEEREARAASREAVDAARRSREGSTDRAHLP